MSTLRNVSILLMLGIGGRLAAQSDGEIHGQVVDELGRPVMLASVAAEQGGWNYLTQTDTTGHYVLKPLPAGGYTVRVSFIGMQYVEVTDVRVDPGLINTMAPIVMRSEVLGQVEIVRYKWEEPLIRKDDPSCVTLTGEQVRKSPLRYDLPRLIAQYAPGPGVGTYFVDGVRMTGPPRMPSDAIGSITIYTGPVPARYGDVVGGVAVIETRSYFDLQQRNAKDR